MGMLSATPRPLYPRCTQLLVPLHKWLGGPRGRSEWVRKMSPPPGFEPRTVHPVTSRYTDYAVIQCVPADISPGLKRRVLELTIRRHLMLRLWMSGTIPACPHVFMEHVCLQRDIGSVLYWLQDAQGCSILVEGIESEHKKCQRQLKCPFTSDQYPSINFVVALYFHSSLKF